MNKDDSSVVAVFEDNLTQQPDIAIAVAAIQALTHVVKTSKATTIMGLEVELKAAADKLKAKNKTSISLSAGCELFNRYVTRTSLEIADYEKCKERLIARGAQFAQMSMKSRKKISEFGDRFIGNDQVILTHGYSRVVINVLLHAAQQRGKYFSVIVTEGRPHNAGVRTAEELLDAGIPTKYVLDSAVGYVMEKVDLVLLGAEAVVESGGIINMIGTYTVAMAAKAHTTPLYVCAESYKFARLFPLTQADLGTTNESHGDRQLLLPVPSDILAFDVDGVGGFSTSSSSANMSSSASSGASGTKDSHHRQGSRFRDAPRIFKRPPNQFRGGLAHPPLYRGVSGINALEMSAAWNTQDKAASTHPAPISESKQKSISPEMLKFPDKLQIENPRVDYTPPSYITLLFTDLGILTPSAVSDELIKLYY